MFLNGASVRRVWEGFANGDSSFKHQAGPSGFDALVKDMLGLREDAYGRLDVHPTMEDGRAAVRPEAFSLNGLAKGICGEAWADQMDPRRTMESATTAISPANLPATSGFYSTVSNLMTAKTLAAYKNPAYIADRLMPTVPSRFKTERLPGMQAIGNQARSMSPGQSHPRANFGDYYIDTPETEKFGLGVDVTQEAVFFDRTNMVLSQAAGVGEALSLNKEKRCLRVILGITNPYKFMGTGYNTYLSSGDRINTAGSSELIDWTDIDAADILASKITDPFTGELISVDFDTIVVPPSKLKTAEYITNATEIERDTNSGAERLRAANAERGRFQIVSSPQILALLIANSVNAANAANYWVRLNRAKAFAYMENWSIMTKTPSANDYAMADNGLVFSQFTNEQGAPAVMDPRYAQLFYQS